ncbi:hypothetical protein ABEY37_00965 [Bacillus pacificus]
MTIKYDKKTVLRLPEEVDEYYESEAKRMGIKANTLKTMILVRKFHNKKN